MRILLEERTLVNSVSEKTGVLIGLIHRWKVAAHKPLNQKADKALEISSYKFFVRNNRARFLTLKYTSIWTWMLLGDLISFENPLTIRLLNAR